MLDYGCGSGGFQEITMDRRHLASWLMQNGNGKSVGVDINPENIMLAKRRIRNGPRFVVADGRSLPFRDGCFDVVHEFGVLHHMRGYGDGLREIARVLKFGGRLLLTESVDNDPLFYIFRCILGSWQGDKISSLFDSEALDEQLERCFSIKVRRYYWRFIISDFLRMCNVEPRASLVFNDVVSKMLTYIRLDKYACCHYYVEATKL